MTTKTSITNFVRQHKSITVATLALAVIIAVIFGVLPLFNSTTGYVNVNALPASDTFVYVTPYGNEIGFVGGVGAGTGAGSGLPITQPATISVKDLTTGQILSYTVQPIAYQLQWYMFDFTTMTVTLSNTDYFPTPEPTVPPTSSPTPVPTPIRYYIAYSSETLGTFSSIKVTDTTGNQVFSGTYGESLTITATPSTGQTFRQWNILNTDGSLNSIVTQNPYTFTLTNSITFVALTQNDAVVTPIPTATPPTITMYVSNHNPLPTETLQITVITSPAQTGIATLAGFVNGAYIGGMSQSLTNGGALFTIQASQNSWIPRDTSIVFGVNVNGMSSNVETITVSSNPSSTTTPAPTWNIPTATPAPTSAPNTNISLATILTAVVVIAIIAVTIVFVLIAKKEKRLPI